MSNEKTQQAIEEQGRKMMEEHKKMMNEHWGFENKESDPEEDLKMFQLDNSSGSNTILGSLDGSKDGQWTSHAMESHHSNNNGIEDNFKTYSVIEQRPDGSCVKRVAENRNGREEVKEYPMDCERAKMEVKKNNEKTQQVVEAQSRKMDEYHTKMMEEHRRRIDEQIKMMEEHTRKMNEQHETMIEEQRQATKQIQDRIKASFANLFKTENFN
uniref:Uncharacterized protein n=2 Tax=Cuerna arida TaxID=1464854 RepID=A0A1B6EP75_9HEMI